MSAHVRAVLLLVVVAVGVQACAGDEHVPLAKVELVRRANRICSSANDAIARLRTPDPLDAAASADALGAILHRQRIEVRALRALAPPERDARGYLRWLAQVDLALEQADRSRDAVRATDVMAAAAANQRGEALRRSADRFATAYGITHCAAV